jgi:hydroxypyruvate isomerase
MEPFDLCPCLDALFPGAPVERVLPQLAGRGFRCVEFWDWRPRDVAALARAAEEAGVRVHAFSGNTFAEPLVDPEAHDHTLAHLRRALAVAPPLGARLLVVHSGYLVAGRSRSEQWTAAVRGLRAAGDLAGAAGITLVVEPLNSRIDHPGYFLDTLPEALRLLAAVAHPAVRLLLDVYHMRVMHEDLLERLPEALAVTAHVHVADVPGRGEPGSGQIAWPAVLEALRAGGYQGAIGLECWPTGTAEAALRRSAQILAPHAARRLVGWSTTP